VYLDGVNLNLAAGGGGGDLSTLPIGDRARHDGNSQPTRCSDRDRAIAQAATLEFVRRTH